MPVTRTYHRKQAEVKQNWFLIDAKDEILGRLASRIALILRGKNRPDFSPHLNPQNHCVVINADKIRLTGKKWKEKIYHKHSGWHGGLRSFSAEQLAAKNPTKLLELAIKNMLPKNALGRRLFLNVHIYAGDQHPHQAQNPKPIKITKQRSEEK